MRARDILSYLSYLDKLVGEKPIYTDCSALTEEIEINGKSHQFKVGARVRITRHKYFLAKIAP